MNTQNPNDTDDADLEGFETPEEDFHDASDSIQEDGSEGVDDADFQDVSDDIDADVFGEEQPAEQPAKKKVNWFNIGVAVIAIAVAGGLIWSKLGPQIMGGEGLTSVANAPANPVATPVNKTDSQAAAQAAVGSSLGGNAVGTALLENPDQFATLNQSPAPEAQAAPVPTSDPFAALGAATPALPMPAPISGTPTPSSTEGTPKAAAPSAVTAEPVQPQPVTETPKEVAIAPSLPVSAASNADDGALKAQVTALEQKLEALDSKISSAVEQLNAAAPVAAPVDDARLSSIQSALERLETRLDDLSSNRRAATQVSIDNDEPAPKKTVKKAAKAKVSTSSKSQSKWDQPYSPPSASAPVVQPAAAGSSGWSLRGAQTGRAVIAKGNDLREVGIGETVPGLGEITGIANMGGRWVVQGTQGRLSQ